MTCCVSDVDFMLYLKTTWSGLVIFCSHLKSYRIQEEPLYAEIPVVYPLGDKDGSVGKYLANLAILARGEQVLACTEKLSYSNERFLPID